MTGIHLSRTLALAVVLGGLALPAAAQTRYPYSLTLYDQPDYRGGSVTFYGDNANIGSTGFANRARSAQIRGAWRLCEGGGYRNRCEVLTANIRDLDAYGFSRRVGSAQLLGAGAAPPAPQPAPPAYVPPPYPPATPPAAPYWPAPYGGPAMGPGPVPPSQFAPYSPPAAPLAPAHPAPYSAGSYQTPPDTLPPAVDAPLAAPSHFGRSYDPPAGAAAPRAFSGPAYPAPDARAAPMPPQSAPYPAAPAYGADSAQGATTAFFPFPTLGGADVSAASPQAANVFCRVQGLGPAVYFDQSQRLPRAVDGDGRAVGEGPVLRDVLCRR